MKTNDIGGARPQPQPRGPEESASRGVKDGKESPDAGRDREALEKDVGDFGAFMKKPAKKQPGQGQDGTGSGGGKGPGGGGQGEGMESEGMASLFGGMSGLAMGKEAASVLLQPQGQLASQAPSAPSLSPATAGPAAAATAARCGELVERILVSAPEPASRPGSLPEVRLKVDEAWLPRTEIAIVRDADGALAVEFLSDSVESQRFLLPNLANLRTRLEENVDAPRVVVRMSEGSQGGDNQEGRRSRERRNLYEEMSD